MRDSKVKWKEALVGHAAVSHMLSVWHLSRFCWHSSAVATYTAVINSLSKNKYSGENNGCSLPPDRDVNSHKSEWGKGHDRVLGRVWTLGQTALFQPFLCYLFPWSLWTPLLSLNFIFCVHIMDITPSIFKGYCEEHNFWAVPFSLYLGSITCHLLVILLESEKT